MGDNKEKDIEMNNEMSSESENAETSAEKSNEENGKGRASKKDKKSDPEKKIKKLNDEIEKLKEENEAALKEQNEKYLRLAAEYDNFRKRSQREKDSIYGDAVADAVLGLVPVIDNIMYAEQYGDNENPEKFAEGVRLILSKLPETLEKMGVSVYGEKGDKFDPNLHSAVMHVEDDSLEEGQIVEVFQKGYKYKDKVIRYAMVKVAN